MSLKEYPMLREVAISELEAQGEAVDYVGVKFASVSIDAWQSRVFRIEVTPLGNGQFEFQLVFTKYFTGETAHHDALRHAMDLDLRWTL